jgi:hypothetical protein
MQKKRCKQRKSKNRFRNTVNHFQNWNVTTLFSKRVNSTWHVGDLRQTTFTVCEHVILIHGITLLSAQRVLLRPQFKCQS